MDTCRRSWRSIILLILGVLWWREVPTYGQQSTRDQVELQDLKQEVRLIEARIALLEASQATTQKSAENGSVAPTSAIGPTTASQAAPPPLTGAAEPEAVKEAEHKGLDTMDAGMGGKTINIPMIPTLKIRGFGDVRGFVANQNLAVINSFDPGVTTIPAQGGNSTFALGIMDLFITSKISDRFSYLSEVGFEANPAANGIGVDLERAQINFTLNDYFTLAAGRTHAMLGYYNTAFHHGTWFQTTIDRPHIFQFEDSGGPLPIHNVGVAAMGAIPSGGLGLHWFAEAGNGKQTYSLEANVTPANVLADHTGKSTNIGLLARPPAIAGLQAGFDWYQAALVPVVSLLPGYGTPAFAFPDAVAYYKQNIFIGHVIYITPRFEFMAEDAEIRDLPRGSPLPLYTSGGYAQISKAFRNYRPYFRYQWLNPNFRDPNNAWVGRWVGPEAGLRVDVNPFVAFKVEYEDYDWKDFSTDDVGTQILPIQHKTIHQLGMQIAYTF
jgi:hypothetical protein